MTDNLNWRISTYSGGGGSCVEIAAEPDQAYVRNSNHRDAGTLSVPRDVMADWVAAFDAGEYDDLTG